MRWSSTGPLSSLLVSAFLAIGCGNNPLAPSALSGSAAGNAELAAPTAGPKTRALLNSNKKVVGIRFLRIGDVLYDVTFSGGGLSYDQAIQSLRQPDSLVSFVSSAEAIAAVDAIRAFFNTSDPPIKPSDVGWDTLNNSDSRGDVVVPYAVTASFAPYAYSGWDGPTQTWISSRLFGFERDRQLTSAAAWTFFTAFKGSPPLE